MLKIKNVHKYYILKNNKNPWLGKKQTIKALDGISLNLTPGIYGLLGPNGAGKSTLINILIGLLLQDKGSVTWENQPIRKMGRRYRKLLGYMPQQQNLYDSFTGRSFIEYFCALKGIPNKEICAEINRVISKVNLADNLDKQIGAYSGGMKQRLLIAASLIGNPKIVIMDEPTAGLDPKERVRFREILQENKDKQIILVATHVVSDIERIAKSVILLKSGKIVAQNSTKSLVQQFAPTGTLEDVYLHVFGEESDA